MKYICTVFLLAMLATVQAQAGTLTATVDRTRMNNNETLALTLQYDDDADEEPDTRALEQQFNILSNNKASSISIVNGDASRTTTWYYELLPRKTGTLLIPSFSINGDFSEAITVEVGTGPKNSAQAQQDIYSETILDKDRVMVQQQAVITWRLVSKLNISDPKFMPPQIDGVLAQDLGSRLYQRAASDGSTERVIEQRYALFPQQSGHVIIPPQQFQVTVNTMRRSSMGIVHPGRTQARIPTEQQQLDVLPADTQQLSDWLPATALEISQELTGTGPGQQATVGEAFTRTVKIRAEGLIAEQLPALELQGDGFKAYSEKPVLENSHDEQGVTGVREERAAIIATRPGKLTLPAIRIPWYDVAAAQWREAVLPETVVDVQPGANTTTAPPAATTPAAAPTTPATATGDTIPAGVQDNAAAQQLQRWQAFAAVLVALLHLLLLALYRLQKKSGMQAAITTPQGKSGQTSHAQLAMHSDLKAMHRELLAWGRQSDANAAALQDPAIAPLMLTLEKHLYGNGPAPDADALEKLPAHLQQLATEASNTRAGKQQLDDLYR